MKIIIIGAGISGCTAYLQLKKHLPRGSGGSDAHSVTIYEAYDTGKDTTHVDRGQGETHSSTLVVGGGLGVAANGLGVLKRLDETLLSDFVRGGYVVQAWNMKAKDGSVLVHMDLHDGLGGGPSAGKDMTAGEGALTMVGTSRQNLWRCLRVRIPDGDVVTKRISSVVAGANGRHVVSFADGSAPVEADLVIGADGLKSIARRAVFPDDGEDPYPAHYE
jgi:2-polyprenyl-6-methoxyphenol hydroxylase-like FAD-dependent oxidoreductase